MGYTCERCRIVKSYKSTGRLPPHIGRIAHQCVGAALSSRRRGILGALVRERHTLCVHLGFGRSPRGVVRARCGGSRGHYRPRGSCVHWRAPARPPARKSCLTALQIQVSARGQSPQKRIQRRTRVILKPLTRVRCERRPCGATVRSLCQSVRERARASELARSLAARSLLLQHAPLHCFFLMVSATE
jgi:hypothetical protein